MTSTNDSRTATPVPARTSGKPAALFSDEASAVMRPAPRPTRLMARPLDTLTWQEPSALEAEDDL
ncbi:hypothetical protein O1Q96_23200 [Streptomyces sp. Qhu-G9]|uniref:hypothetical protein n=1 Tax=Streptomyces sp. Qhu-G9 TaxID=3452799 RepID=UPI0022AC55F9|nr:hypothetical protein [Streptomyces aurantiacus]WAU82407.1 hypothetical protein O1Q96_23200 [Streptomyces aurantiacus]